MHQRRHSHLRLLTLLSLLISGMGALSQLPPPAGHAAGLGGRGVATQLDTYLSSLAAQDHFSGAVLVARKGTILLSKGYGTPDRAPRVPNTAATTFEVSGVQGGLAFFGALWLEEHGQLLDRAPICRYLPHCPTSWTPITVHMVLAGTSHLPGFPTDDPRQTTVKSLHLMQSDILGGAPGSLPVSYSNGESLILGLLTEKISGQPWGAFMQQTVFGPAGMTQTVAPISSFFPVRSTVADVYAYDTALFGGKLLAPDTLRRLVEPRASAPLSITGFTQTHYGYGWFGGRLLGHAANFTIRRATANLHFPQDGLTLVVINTSKHGTVLDSALHLAALLFGQRLAAPPTLAAPLAAALVGTYRRIFQDADRRAAHDPGLADVVGQPLVMTINNGWIDFCLTDCAGPHIEEYVAATQDGRFTLGSYRPTNGDTFCTDSPVVSPPQVSYRWARQGTVLIITRTTFDPCLDRGALLPGRWSKIR